MCTPVRIRTNRAYGYLLVLATVILAGCSSATDPVPVNVAEERFQLGRKLFYDARLSRDGSTSCGSCHQQSYAFTQHGHAVSHGIADRTGIRNSLPIQNLVSRTAYFWDGGITDVVSIPLAAISDTNELGETLPSILNKLRGDAGYRERFRNAYDDDSITTTSFLHGLASFTLELVSENSRYDSVRRGTASYTEAERKGADAFTRHCSTCHLGPDLTDDTYRDNGIGIGPAHDPGRYRISLNEQDRYHFRVPSLRNVAVTAPYMHDGRFRTLDAVVKHYTTVFPNLSAADAADIVAFLHTLTDHTFLTNPRFGETP